MSSEECELLEIDENCTTTPTSLFNLPGSKHQDVPKAKRGRRSRTGIRKEQFRWNYFKDLALVTEVERFDPYGNVGSAATEKWTEIAAAITAQFEGSVTATGVKERCNRLLSSHRSEDFKTRYKSGTEQEVTALTGRLADLDSKNHDRKLEEKEAFAVKSRKINEEKAAGEEIRKAAISNRLKRKAEDDISTPVKRTTEKSLVDLWKEKQEEDRQLQNKRFESEIEQRNLDRDLRKEELMISQQWVQQEEKRLELERLKVQLESEKLASELRLSQERFQLEKMERLSQMKTQEKLIELLSKK